MKNLIIAICIVIASPMFAKGGGHGHGHSFGHSTTASHAHAAHTVHHAQVHKAQPHKSLLKRLFTRKRTH